MPHIDCGKEMNGYHADDVVLSTPDQDQMRGRRNSGRKRLKNGLDAAGHPLPDSFHSQGSYAMRTMVQDNQCDYDIDDGVYFDKENLKNANGEYLTAVDARIRIRKALEDGRLARPARVKTNCVRQMYPEGYHIDMPVYRISQLADNAENKTEKYELASGNAWIESDARSVTRWFNNAVGHELQAGETDYSQTRRITRLTKKMARSRIAWKAKTTSGICISKLVVDHICTSAGRDDIALRNTWNAIKSSLVVSLQVDHPVLPGKQLADQDDEGVRFFRECLADSLEVLDVLDNYDCSRKQAHKAWDDVFNTSYFGDQLDDDGEKAAAPFAIISTEAADRQDGGRRFG